MKQRKPSKKNNIALQLFDPKQQHQPINTTVKFQPRITTNALCIHYQKKQLGIIETELRHLEKDRQQLLSLAQSEAQLREALVNAKKAAKSEFITILKRQRKSYITIQTLRHLKAIGMSDETEWADDKSETNLRQLIIDKLFARDIPADTLRFHFQQTHIQLNRSINNEICPQLLKRYSQIRFAYILKTYFQRYASQNVAAFQRQVEQLLDHVMHHTKAQKNVIIHQLHTLIDSMYEKHKKLKKWYFGDTVKYKLKDLIVILANTDQHTTETTIANYVHLLRISSQGAFREPSFVTIANESCNALEVNQYFSASGKQHTDPITKKQYVFSAVSQEKQRLQEIARIPFEKTVTTPIDLALIDTAILDTPIDKKALCKNILIYGHATECFQEKESAAIAAITLKLSAAQEATPDALFSQIDPDPELQALHQTYHKMLLEHISDITQKETEKNRLTQKIQRSKALALELLNQQVRIAHHRYRRSLQIKPQDMRWIERFNRNATQQKKAATLLTQALETTASYKTGLLLLKAFLRRKHSYRNHDFATYLLKELFNNQGGIFSYDPTYFRDTLESRFRHYLSANINTVQPSGELVERLSRPTTLFQTLFTKTTEARHAVKKALQQRINEQLRQYDRIETQELAIHQESSTLSATAL